MHTGNARENRKHCHCRFVFALLLQHLYVAPTLHGGNQSRVNNAVVEEYCGQGKGCQWDVQESGATRWIMTEGVKADRAQI
jgi:hypothetical protein